MRILAASLIDGENISPKFANDLYQVLSNEAQHGVSVVARLLIGNPQSLGAWSMAAHSYHFQARTHHGGRNAADHLIRDEALKLARQGVKRFYLVSNDGGFAATAGLLHYMGCQVVGFGTALAAKQWQESCDLFFLLGTDPSAVVAAITTVLNRERHSLAHSEGDTMEPFSSLDILSLPDAEKTQEALRTIYGSAAQPPLLTNLLFLFLQHTLLALCLTEQDSTLPSQWSAGADVEVLTSSMRDPIISLILEHDPSLKATWQSMTAFAHRCQDAYEQGRAAALLAFPLLHVTFFTLNFFPFLLALVAVFVFVLTVRLVPWTGAASMVVVVFLLIFLLVSVFVPPMMTLLVQAEHQVYLARASRIGSTIVPLLGQTPMLVLSALSFDGVVWLARRGEWTFMKRDSWQLVAGMISMFLVNGFILVQLAMGERAARGGGGGMGRFALGLALSLLLTIPASLLGNWAAVTISQTVQALRR